jgi:hypothetical protein
MDLRRDREDVLRSADIGRFRLRAFEHDWVAQLENPEQPELSAVLIDESRRWIEVGLSTGYFAGETVVGRARIDIDPNVMRFLELTLSDIAFADHATFADALADGQDDLTRARRAYLDRLVFSTPEVWEGALLRVMEYADMLRQLEPEEAATRPAPSLEWALAGADSDIGGAPKSPASWRTPESLAQLVPERCAALGRLRTRLEKIILARAETSLVEQAHPNAVVRPVERSREVVPASTKGTTNTALEALSKRLSAYRRYFNQPGRPSIQRLAGANESTVELLRREGYIQHTPALEVGRGREIYLAWRLAESADIALRRHGFEPQATRLVVGRPATDRGAAFPLHRAPPALYQAQSLQLSVWLESTFARTVGVMLLSTDLPRFSNSIPIGGSSPLCQTLERSSPSRPL